MTLNQLFRGKRGPISCYNLVSDFRGSAKKVKQSKQGRSFQVIRTLPDAVNASKSAQNLMSANFSYSRHCTHRQWSALWLVWLLGLSGPIVDVRAEDIAPSFFRGLNFNGPTLMIDGQLWQGKTSPLYRSTDKSFENQSITLDPPTDSERATMIRSSLWGGNRIELLDIPDGLYTVFLYVWEDNNTETYSIAVNGRQVVPVYKSGAAGQWQKLGPWFTSPSNSKIVVSSRGGAANFSGIEIWRGEHDGLPDISDEHLAFFEKRIRPVLVDKCYRCHSTAAEELAADLLVDSRSTLRRGGVSGPAIIPGDVENSLLIRAIRFDNSELQMPPDAKLTDGEIADLEQWVAIGAPDPRAATTSHPGKQFDLEAAKQFWSLQPVGRPNLPEDTSQWSQNEIDRFILAKLQEHGLRPTAAAHKRELIRRVSYDLIGLPPTPEEVADFLADDSSQAFAVVVDRLLESPRYGERWGRHWLDVVRYADTAGDNSDYPVPQIRLYRDWVIDAFNHDLPYDEFVRDQLAGDLRGGSSDSQRFQRIIATGYLANSRRFGSRVDDYPQHLTIEDTIDNLGRVFLGMTLSCARCHDHKFDPLTTRDYYGLYGIFHSTRYPWPGIELDKRQRDFVPLVPQEQLAQIARIQETHAKELKSLEKNARALKEELKGKSAAERTAVEQQLRKAEQAVESHVLQTPYLNSAYAVADAAVTEDAPVQLKGDPTRLGDVVPRHFPAVLGGGELPQGADFSGRAQLAEWIMSPENPLAARVMINRIWQHHFGRGIVPTPNDFGRQGKPPTHPELLDFLAAEFRECGWSIKTMHRRILLSSTYQQSSRRDPLALQADPTNQWLSGFPRQRLDAESIRDTLLAVGGSLDFSTPGPHPFPAMHTWGFTQHKPFKAVYEHSHSSVFLMTQRIQRHPFLAIFDGADPSTSTASRMASTTPLQALYLLNDPFVHEQSRRVVERLLRQAPDEAGRIRAAYLLLFSRPASDDEYHAARVFIDSAGRLLGEGGSAADRIEAEAWQAWVRTLFRLNEFVTLD